jgi:hypothetical protein
LVSESDFGLETDRDLSSQAALGNGANELVKLQDKRARRSLGRPTPRVITVAIPVDFEKY